MGGEVHRLTQNTPYYKRNGFDWGDTSKWINDQKAVNYWMRYIKPNRNNNYPDDFSSKTY